MKTQDWNAREQVKKMEAFLTKEFKITNEKKEMYFYFLRSGDIMEGLFDKGLSEGVFKIVNDKYVLQKMRKCNSVW